MTVKIVHLDFETRATVDLTEVGAYRYAQDPTCRILMAGVSAHDRDDVLLWVNPWLHDLVHHADRIQNNAARDLLIEADLVYAHNADFEAALMWGRGLADMGVEVDVSKWRCTAAMARKAGLPSSLEKAAEALGLPQQKDRRGKALIRKFSIPREDGTFELCEGADWDAFKEYCIQDVKVEKAIHKKLTAFELTGSSLATFQFNLRLNERGIPVNVPALKHAQSLINEAQNEASNQFRQLTGLNITQREKIRALVGLLNMQSETVAEALGKLPAEDSTAAILSLYQKLSFAAAKKVDAMLACACEDGRVRGGHQYYGAGTGRWSGRLIQPQNFKKTPGWMKGMTTQVYQAIQQGATADELSVIYGEPVELISGIIRHFIHAPGHQMIDADYNAIEARIITWLAGETKTLEMWRKGADLYKFMAARIYGKDEKDVTPEDRTFGKVAILGLGFGMGATKFRSTCEMYGIDCSVDLAERAVEMYRATNPAVVRYWYYLDECARKAIGAPGKEFGPFKVHRISGVPYLLGRLPSGRQLAYPHPLVEVLEGDNRSQITYWGAIPGTVAWSRVKLYGGKLAENFTQATAACVMAHGALLAESQGYEIFMLVHDQALALAGPDLTPDGFGKALATVPPWATGLPLKVEAKLTPYYTK